MSEPTIYKPSIYNGNGVYKNGASGGGGGGIVPDEFYELEYLQISEGIGPANFAINVNSFSNDNKDFKMTLENEITTANTENVLFLLDNTLPYADGGGIITVYRGANKYSYETYNGRGWPGYQVDNIIFTGKYKITMKNNDVYIEASDGNNYQWLTGFASYSFSKVYLFTDRTNTPNRSWYGKFYDMDIEGVLKLVPVKRKLDGIIGLFDLISQVFITANYGQSNLIAGPIKV